MLWLYCWGVTVVWTHHEKNELVFVFMWYALLLYRRSLCPCVRYSSCRYNERQLIKVAVVRRVRPRAER